MFSGILRHLLRAYAALLCLVILSNHHSCSARNNNNYCTPSSCGNIYNISYPFRLNTDPKSCGHKNYELICENNRPTLYFKGGKYYVQEINYESLTIRLVDAGVQKDDCFSLPQHTFLDTDDICRSYLFRSYFSFLTCANPILSAIDILHTSSCKSDSFAVQDDLFTSHLTFNITSPSSHDMEGYSYVMVVADMGDIPDLCHINLSYPMSFCFEHVTNISYIDFHDILVYGFELDWTSACCDFDKENRCDYFDEATMGMFCYDYNFKLSVGDKIKNAMASLSYGLLRLFVLAPISNAVRPLRKYIPWELVITYSREGG